MPLLDEQRLIVLANELERDRVVIGPAARTVLEACEIFWGHGMADEQSGDADAPTGHFYRVGRWIVTTDSQGFQSLEAFETEREAEDAFEVRDVAFAKWADEDD